LANQIEAIGFFWDMSAFSIKYGHLQSTAFTQDAAFPAPERKILRQPSAASLAYDEEKRKMEEATMKVSLENIVSISEANQNFSRIARMVDKCGSSVILKNNTPRYVIVEYALLKQGAGKKDIDLDEAAKLVLSKPLQEFEQRLAAGELSLRPQTPSKE
jgi:antitoxin Phd